MGAEAAPVEGVFADPGTDRVDSVGVLRTDWPSQNIEDRITKRNSFCVINRRRADGSQGSTRFQGEPCRSVLARQQAIQPKNNVGRERLLVVGIGWLLAGKQQA